MKSTNQPYSRSASTDDIYGQVTLNPLDELLNLKYTPYTKIIHHKDKTVDEYYIVVCFLSGKGSEIRETSNTILDGKLCINIEVFTGNADESSCHLSQVIFNTDDIKEISNIIRNNITVNYVVTISYGHKIDKSNKLMRAGSNSGGGVTDPADPYPPA
jgi:hypothetical protein